MAFMWRLFRDKSGTPSTLFHGVGGTTKLPLNTWLDAEHKLAVDGAGQKPYLTGFHVARSLAHVCKILGYFHKLGGLVACRVEVEGELRPKPRSRMEALLAPRMRIHETDWKERVPVVELLKSLP